jgi:thiosulfate dehydrogenase (quinone) large subunit
MAVRPMFAAPRESVWSRRLIDPGWLLLPLRGFLGITFCFAGLQKLANPSYFNPHSPASVAAQMRLQQHTSPIGPLVGLATHAPTFVGLVIAIGELAVGIGTLLGLCVRIAALGGLLLSLTFFLTVSWNTSPYYYGSDIVFVFAWLTVFAFGPAIGLSLDSWLRNRARASLRLGPEPAAVEIGADRLHALCPLDRNCGMQADGQCARARCAVFLSPRRGSADTAEVDRRTVMQTGAAAAVVAGGAAVLGGATAAIGRAEHQAGATNTPGAAAGPVKPRRSAHGNGTGRSARSHPGTGATVIAATSAIPVGNGKSFIDPGTGEPAWAVHPASATFVAFSAICTHAGCTVQYDPSTVQFVCPCHGGTFDARTGRVVAGPPPAPLQAIPVRAVDGQLRVNR